MNINWFPGHMRKALREIERRLPSIDLCCEILDARIPFSSSNPILEELTERKPRLVLLNKADMADPVATKGWISHFERQGQRALAICADRDPLGSRIRKEAEYLLQEKRARERQRGQLRQEIRMLCFGIPNSGKSTLINNLARRRSAKVGDRPGVTQAQQWIKADADLLLMDTPGILWPKFTEEQALHLAFTGAIRDEVLSEQDIGYALLETVRKFDPERLIKRYALPAEASTLEWMEKIARDAGCLFKGGHIDYDRVARRILDDYRKNRWGALSLEEAPVEA